MLKNIYTIPQVYAQIVDLDSANTFCDLNDIISNVIRVAVPLAGIALFFMLVWGGFHYLSSGGDPKGTEQAKGTITFAIAGIILMILAWFILRFITLFTEVDVTSF